MTDLDKVRLLVGDTDSGDPQLSDPEIEALLEARTAEGSTNVVAAAADAASAIAAIYAREFDFAEDAQTFDRSQRYEHYYELEKTLRVRAGGISVRLST